MIDRAHMHITALSCTAIDNPTGESVAERVDNLFPYFETDTIRFRDDTFPNFVELQVLLCLLGLGFLVLLNPRRVCTLARVPIVPLAGAARRDESAQMVAEPVARLPRCVERLAV